MQNVHFSSAVFRANIWDILNLEDIQNMAKYTEAKKNSNKKWDSQNLERISVTFPVGSLEQIASAAEITGQSKNAFCRSAILSAASAALNPAGDHDSISGSAEDQPQTAPETDTE